MLNPIQAVEYLVLEYFPEDVPLTVRAAAAFQHVEDIFGEPVPTELPPGDHPHVTEEDLIDYVSDYAFRPIGEGAWVLVDLTDNGAPAAVLTPA